MVVALAAQSVSGTPVILVAAGLLDSSMKLLLNGVLCALALLQSNKKTRLRDKKKFKKEI